MVYINNGIETVESRLEKWKMETLDKFLMDQIFKYEK